MVAAFCHVLMHQFNQFAVHQEIRETLSQVDGLMLYGQCAHGGENGGAHMRQLAMDG